MRRVLLALILFLPGGGLALLVLAAIERLEKRKG